MKWINCSERLPTEADGDAFGKVVMRIRKSVYAVPMERAKHYDQRLSGACESEQAEGEGESKSEVAG